MARIKTAKTPKSPRRREHLKAATYHNIIDELDVTLPWNTADYVDRTRTLLFCNDLGLAEETSLKWAARRESLFKKVWKVGDSHFSSPTLESLKNQCVQDIATNSRSALAVKAAHEIALMDRQDAIKAAEKAFEEAKERAEVATESAMSKGQGRVSRENGDDFKARRERRKARLEEAAATEARLRARDKAVAEMQEAADALCRMKREATVLETGFDETGRLRLVIDELLSRYRCRVAFYWKHLHMPKALRGLEPLLLTEDEVKDSLLGLTEIWGMTKEEFDKATIERAA